MCGVVQHNLEEGAPCTSYILLHCSYGRKKKILKCYHYSNAPPFLILTEPELVVEEGGGREGE